MCIKNVTTQYEELTKSCPCKVACYETDFTAVMSSSTWPSNQYWYDMATSLNPELISKNRDEIEDVRVKIQQDYARVDIYYQTLNLKEIMQSPTISFDSLFSQIGGAISLYLGISVIMAFEVFELIGDLVMAIFKYCQTPRPKKL